MADERHISSQEPVLPDWGTSIKAPTTAELWALNAWTTERREFSTSPLGWKRILPMAGVVLPAALMPWTAGRLSSQSIVHTALPLMYGVALAAAIAFSSFERRGFIRLAQRYSDELRRLRAASESPRTPGVNERA